MPVLTADGLCLCSRDDLHTAAPGPPSRAACRLSAALGPSHGGEGRPWSEPLPAALLPMLPARSSRRSCASVPRWEHVTWAGALRGHRLHPSQARAVRVPKGLPPLGHERIFVAGPGGCLLVHLGSTCWLISASRARPPPAPSELQGGRGQRRSGLRGKPPRPWRAGGGHGVRGAEGGRARAALGLGPWPMCTAAQLCHQPWWRVLAALTWVLAAPPCCGP